MLSTLAFITSIFYFFPCYSQYCNPSYIPNCDVTCTTNKTIHSSSQNDTWYYYGPCTNVTLTNIENLNINCSSPDSCNRDSFFILTSIGNLIFSCKSGNNSCSNLQE